MIRGETSKEEAWIRPHLPPENATLGVHDELVVQRIMESSLAIGNTLQYLSDFLYWVPFRLRHPRGKPLKMVVTFGLHHSMGKTLEKTKNKRWCHWKILNRDNHSCNFQLHLSSIPLFLGSCAFIDRTVWREFGREIGSDRPGIRTQTLPATHSQALLSHGARTAIRQPSKSFP